jgi:hypothetical protein
MYYRTAVYLYSMSDCFENKISTSPPGHLESRMGANSPVTDITPNYQWPDGLLRNHSLLTPSPSLRHNKHQFPVDYLLSDLPQILNSPCGHFFSAK